MPILKYPNKKLVEHVPSTYLSADYLSVGVGSVTVENAGGASGYDYAVLEDVGSERWEILQISSTSGNTINFTGTTVYTHVKGTVVHFVNYNEVEFSYASTKNGSKSVLVKKAINGSDENTYYEDQTNSSGFAFVRLYSGADTAYANYSSAIPYQYSRKTARELIKSALQRIGEEHSTKITTDYAYNQINACETEVAHMKGRGKWSWLRSGDYDAGSLVEGQWRIQLPEDIEDNETDGSIYTVRFGRSGELHYKDKEAWLKMTQSMAYTTVNGNQTAGAGTVTGVDFSNFPSSGVVKIGTNEISYTGKTETTLTGVTGFTANISDGDFIFYKGVFGKPRFFTVFDNYLYVYPIVDTNFSGQSIWLDYYHSPGNISRGYDETLIPNETLVIDYLEWAFDKRLNNGQSSPSGQQALDRFLAKADVLRRSDFTGREIRFRAPLGYSTRQPIIKDDELIF